MRAYLARQSGYSWRSNDQPPTDEVSGEHISYVARDERYVVTQRRGVMVLQPVRKDPLLMPASSVASATASAPGHQRSGGQGQPADSIADMPVSTGYFSVMTQVGMCDR